MAADYLRLIDTQTPPGQRYDVTPLFADADALRQVVEDLCAPFLDADVDFVAGIDALGFILGASMATRLGAGFIPIRKGGKLPAAVNAVGFVDYSGERKTLELRKGLVQHRRNLLVVDEWVETGAQMRAAIDLIEHDGGEVSGIATISMDGNPATQSLRERYVVHSLLSDEPEVRD